MYWVIIYDLRLRLSFLTLSSIFHTSMLWYSLDFIVLCPDYMFPVSDETKLPQNKSIPLHVSQ